ncbi:MAG: 4-alpha-glucanotransferase, partial [Rudaea sp.]|nr:4-alpha-glucanotransferase [Rudaea sp.]
WENHAKDHFGWWMARLWYNFQQCDLLRIDHFRGLDGYFSIPAGKPALTHYRVRERFRGHTLIECRLETGRTHQIRVHMAHVKHPLVGDAQYGGGLKLPKGATTELVEALRGFRRQALHAEKLEFEHPVTEKLVSVTVDAPADFAALVQALREDTKVAR